MVTYTTPLNEEGYVVDTLANFHCDSGYRASESSPESRKCERSGDWSGQMQMCIIGNEITLIIHYIILYFLNRNVNLFLLLDIKL